MLYYNDIINIQFLISIKLIKLSMIKLLKNFKIVKNNLFKIN